MGTLILEPAPDGPIRRYGKHFQVFHVIDGQQRLTSIVVLMSCICRLLWNEEQFREVAENLYDKFVAYYKNEADRELQKLVLGKEDNDYFWDTILDTNPLNIDPATPGQRRLIYAKRFFDTKLAQFPTHEVVKFADEIQSGLLLLTYQVSSNLEAGLIFQTINDRGKELSQLDKVKSYLMYVASKTSSANLSVTINAHWGDLLRNIADIDPERDDTEAEENRLIRYHWIMETGDHRAYQIHREVKSKYKLGQADVIDQATQYVRNLAEASQHYLKISHPERTTLFIGANDSIREEIEYYLNCLHRLGTVANFAPLLMAGLHMFSDNPELFSELARYCYLLAWRAYRVCGRRADAGVWELSRLAHDLFKRDLEFSEIEIGFKNLIEGYASGSLFELNLRQNSLSSAEQKFLIYELEMSLSRAKRQPAISWESAVDFQIEHIWAAKPEGSDSWHEDLKEQHHRIVNQLGDIALVPPSWNPQLSNRPLFEKEEKYHTSNLQHLRALPEDDYFREVCALEKNQAQSAEVLNAVEEFVQNRTDNLVKFALDRWKI